MMLGRRKRGREARGKREEEKEGRGEKGEEGPGGGSLLGLVVISQRMSRRPHIRNGRNGKDGRYPRPFCLLGYCVAPWEI